jgi:hypothetical protein
LRAERPTRPRPELEHEADAGDYGSTVFPRVAFYWATRDPLFLVILGVMGLGVVLTATSYWLDWRERHASP